MEEEVGKKCNCKSSFIVGFALPVGLVAAFVTMFFFLINLEAKRGRPEFGSPTLMLGLFILPVLFIVVFVLNIFGNYRIFSSNCPNRVWVLVPNGILFLGLVGVTLYVLMTLSLSGVFR